MICPRCAQPLKEVQHHGIPVDICPRCEGVWLDKGELEALHLKSGSLLNFIRSLFSPKATD